MILKIKMWRIKLQIEVKSRTMVLLKLWVKWELKLLTFKVKRVKQFHCLLQLHSPQNTY